MREPSAKVKPQREGNGESPLQSFAQAIFRVARDDRDGLSRYRETKMSRMG